MNRSIQAMLVAFVLLMLAAPVGAAEKTKVTMWAAGLTAEYDRWITSEFPKHIEQAFPDIEVEVTVVNGRQALEEKMMVARAAGVGPDVFHQSGNYGLQTAYNGLALPLDPFLADWDAADDMIIPDLWKYEGQTIGLPYSISVAGYAYWEDLLDKAGVSPPQSWDEMISATRHLTVHGTSGTLEQAGMGTWDNPTTDGIYTFSVLVDQLGSSVYSEDLSKPQFNTEEGRRALSFAAELYGAAYPSGAKPASRFTSRGAAMQFWFSTEHTRGLSNTYAPDQLAQLRMKRIPGPTPAQDDIAIVNGWGWMISSDSKHPRAAWNVIAEFLSIPVQEEFLVSFNPGGLLSPRRSFAYPSDWPFIEDALVMTQPPLSAWGPIHPFFGEVLEMTRPLIYEAVRGERAIAGALEESDRLLTNLFAEKGL